MTWRIERFDLARHQREGFASGKEQLDQYVRTQLTQDVRRRVLTAFCLIEDDDSCVFGYYTLSAGSVRLHDLAEETQKRLPRYPAVPVYLLGRLAVDLTLRGQGFGGLLLADALQRVQRQEVQAYAVLVDALDEDAAGFYEHFGFNAFPNDSRRLLLPISAIPQGDVRRS